jgi:hypothetical protein
MDDLLNEFRGATLGDERRRKRLLRIVGAAEERPDASFPTMMKDEAGLEAAYRFLSNTGIDHEDISIGHRNETVERARKARQVLVLHDTTACKFRHADPAEVGFLNTGKPGFYAHFSLVVSAATREPLGVIGLETIVRKARKNRSGSTAGKYTTKQPDRESLRWEHGVEKAGKLLSDVDEVIHVADREADTYSLLAQLHQQRGRFVIRVRHDRKAKVSESDPDWSSLKTLANAAKVVLKREVPLTSRQVLTTMPRHIRSNKARRERTARLVVTSTSMVLKRPRHFNDRFTTELSVNVVRVYEPKPPKGEEPVEWLLVTSEPVDDAAAVARVVDIYRARWIIEEFFKALKSGCLYEERQLETRRALLNALAIFTPLACKLLWLRTRARIDDAPFTDVITPLQLDVLRSLRQKPLPPAPTARDVLWAIAGLGGHLKNNGPPGWATLRRGLDRLVFAEVVWLAAKAPKK